MSLKLSQDIPVWKLNSCGKFGEKLNRGFQFSLLKKFTGVGEKVKISNFIAYFFLKVKWVEPETFTGVSCLDAKWLWKVWGKTEWCFRVRPSEKLENLFGVGDKGKISNFIGCLFVKGKLVEPETFTGVYCPDNEGLWKVWGKTESWFPIEPPKNLENFFRVGEKVKISTFIGFFFLKGKLVEPETFTGYSCLETEQLWKVWGKTESWFPIQPTEKIHWSGREGQNF